MEMGRAGVINLDEWNHRDRTLSLNGTAANVLQVFDG